jgi:DNA-binding protein HU-beta
MARLTKQHLVDEVAAKAGLTKKQSGAALNAVLETIQGALAKGDSIGLIGFGTFEVRTRAARDGRNPQTGAPIKIDAKKVPAFKAGKKLKDAIVQ